MTTNLESLISQRDAINAKITEEAAKLGFVPAHSPAMAAVLATPPSTSKRKARPTTARAALRARSAASTTPKRTRKVRVSKPRATPAPKRSADELAAAQDKILTELKRGDALTCEQLQAATGLSKAEIVLPLKQLTKAGKLKTTGQKRATRYSMA